jgi:phytanoyl-CoA hydroxylase
MSAAQLGTGLGRLSLNDIADYRTDGYVVVRAAIGRPLVGDCLAALSGLASGTLDPRGASFALEPAVADHAGESPAAAGELQDKIRKFGEFTAASPALLRAAMSANVHRALDQILGVGRLLFQEMALVKPPRIGSEKPWHQDAAYFRTSDPNLIVGAWIALDPATRDNGCMEFIRGSHLRGPAPHIPAADINVCTVRPDHLRLEDRVAVPMQPGDVLLFHSLAQHYTAPNRSDLRRRALQFHYHQVGLVWTSLEAHTRQFHDETGAYAGCTVAKPSARPGKPYEYRAPRGRPVTPMDED